MANLSEADFDISFKSDFSIDAISEAEIELLSVWLEGILGELTNADEVFKVLTN